MKHIIKVENNRLFDHPVVMVSRHERTDKHIELYVVDESGLEQYAGKLVQPISGGLDVDKIAYLLRAIRNRIKERPLSRESLHWLECLSYSGLLARWEDPE